MFRRPLSLFLFAFFFPSFFVLLLEKMLSRLKRLGMVSVVSRRAGRELPEGYDYYGLNEYNAECRDSTFDFNAERSWSIFIFILIYTRNIIWVHETTLPFSVSDGQTKRMHLSKEGINFSRCLAASLSIISGVSGKYWREGNTALKN